MGEYAFWNLSTLTRLSFSFMSVSAAVASLSSRSASIVATFADGLIGDQVCSNLLLLDGPALSFSDSLHIGVLQLKPNRGTGRFASFQSMLLENVAIDHKRHASPNVYIPVRFITDFRLTRPAAKLDVTVKVDRRLMLFRVIRCWRSSRPSSVLSSFGSLTSWAAAASSWGGEDVVIVPSLSTSTHTSSAVVASIATDDSKVAQRTSGASATNSSSLRGGGDDLRITTRRQHSSCDSWLIGNQFPFKHTCSPSISILTF